MRLIDRLMCGIFVGLPTGQFFFYVIIGAGSTCDSQAEKVN